MRRKTNLRQRSKAMTLKMAAYRVKRAAFLRRNPLCFACKMLEAKCDSAVPSHVAWNLSMVGPKHNATQVHHRRGRASSLLLDTRHWSAVCGIAHEIIGQHPDLARRAGLLCEKGQWNNPRPDMNFADIPLNTPLVFKELYGTPRKVVVVSKIEPDFVKVKPTRGQPIICSSKFLSPPEPKPDRSELTPAEQRVVSILGQFGAMSFGDIAIIANADPDGEGKPWLPRTVAALASRPRLKLRVKVEQGKVGLR